MRHLILTLGLLLPFLTLAQEEIEYKTYSYSELLQKIEQEKDTIFKLNNALIIPNEETDQDFLINFFVQDSTYDGNILTPKSSKEYFIDKELAFRNVLFVNNLMRKIDSEDPNFYGFHHVTFSRPVRIINSSEFIVVDSHFQKD